MSLRLPFAVLLSALIISTPLLAANKGGNAQEEQRERQREQAAEKEVNAARAKVAAAQKEHNAAMQAGRAATSARDNAMKHVQEVRSRLETKYLSKSGLGEARDQHAAIKKE